MRIWWVRPVSILTETWAASSEASSTRTWETAVCPAERFGDAVFAFFHVTMDNGMIGFANAAVRGTTGRILSKHVLVAGHDQAAGGVAVQAVHGEQFWCLELFADLLLEAALAHS
jgi:hypothetical protein